MYSYIHFIREGDACLLLNYVMLATCRELCACRRPASTRISSRSSSVCTCTEIHLVFCARNCGTSEAPAPDATTRLTGTLRHHFPLHVIILLYLSHKRFALLQPKHSFTIRFDINARRSVSNKCNCFVSLLSRHSQLLYNIDFCSHFSNRIYSSCAFMNYCPCTSNLLLFHFYHCLFFNCTWFLDLCAIAYCTYLLYTY